MKWLLRAFLLWLVLGGLLWLLASAAVAEITNPLAAIGIFLLPPVAVWLTVRSAAALPERGILRVGFWTITAGGWVALQILAQGFGETHADERAIVLSGLGLAGLAAGWIAAKARPFPIWRPIREAAAGTVLLALLAGTFLWRYDARTKSIAAQAEARWSEIGLPMAEFEKTLAPRSENAGSVVVRQVLREQVGSRFYRDGTRAAQREPAIERSKAIEEVINRARHIEQTITPPSDDLVLSSKSVAAIKPLASALEADYRRLLATEPAVWSSDPHDGYFISVPNYLGIRHFCQLTAADAKRRFSEGDVEGAGRALAAAQRVREGLRQNPTLVSLMIDVAVEALLAQNEVRLPASENGLQSVAQDVAILRAEYLRRMQIEGWALLRFSDQLTVGQSSLESRARMLPEWARRIADRHLTPRQCATGALADAEHVAIQISPGTLTLPDFGLSLHEAVSAANPSMMAVNAVRAAMRIHATLLLREQSELIRNARARLAVGLPVESCDSAVLPGLRWELTANAEKNGVATRLVGAPEWILKHAVAPREFWVLPLDGSVAWKFHLPAQTANR